MSVHCTVCIWFTLGIFHALILYYLTFKSSVGQHAKTIQQIGYTVLYIKEHFGCGKARLYGNLDSIDQCTFQFKCVGIRTVQSRDWIGIMGTKKSAKQFSDVGQIPLDLQWGSLPEAYGAGIILLFRFNQPDISILDCAVWNVSCSSNNTFPSVHLATWKISRVSNLEPDCF